MRKTRYDYLYVLGGSFDSTSSGCAGSARVSPRDRVPVNAGKIQQGYVGWDFQVPAGMVADLVPDQHHMHIRGDLPGELIEKDVYDTPISNRLAAEHKWELFVLAADANRDPEVNTEDLNLLARDFRGCRTVFSQGDFNYSGRVDSIDFGILVTQYGKQLAATTVAMPSSKRIFGGDR